MATRCAWNPNAWSIDRALFAYHVYVHLGLFFSAVAGSRDRLEARYGRYAEVVTSLLREVLSIQHAGDKEAAGRFFDRWGAWTPEVHERLAARIREAQGPRFRLVRYAALGE